MATSKEVFCGGVKDQQNIHVNTKMCQLVLSYCSLFRTKHFFPNQIHLQETYKWVGECCEHAPSMTL